MQIIRTALILQSYTWTFGNTPQTDSGAIGTYNTPIYLQKGDVLNSIGLMILTNPTSATSAATVGWTDQSANVLGPVFQPFDGTGNYQANNLFGQVSGHVYPAVVTAGFMIMSISAEAFTGGVMRFDFGIIRSY